MIIPKRGTEDFLLSITKNCETLIKQTHRKAEEFLESKLTKQKETFSFKPSINLGADSSWMLGLPCLEIHNSIFNINTRNKKI